MFTFPLKTNRNFLTSEDGAVTVDWTVLTAAIVGLGLASAAAVRTGTGALGTDIQTTLANASVVAILPSQSYTFLFYNSQQQENAESVFAGLSDSYLVDRARYYEQLFDQYMAAGNYRAASMIVDNMYMVGQELNSRGATLPGDLSDHRLLLREYEAATT